MFEHPYLTQQITAFEQERIEREAARRRLLIERADQIVPRPAGPLRRLLQRLARQGARHAARPAAASGAGEPVGAR